MDYFLLPESIKEKLPKGGETPEVFNCAGGIDGGQGSCYLISCPDALRLFYRVFGEDGYKCLSAEFSDPAFSMSLEKDKFNVILAIACSSWSHKLRFSSFDASKIEAFVNKSERTAASPKPCQQPVQKESQKEQGADSSSVEVEPFVGLLAALLLLGHYDGQLDASEEAFIRNMAVGADPALDSALKLFEVCDAESLALALSALPVDDRLCIIANMYDLAMADGLLRAAEQQFVLDFGTHMGIPNDDCISLRDALLVKARVALLKAGGAPA